MAISKVPSSGITADFDNSLTTADLAPNSVDSSELVDGSIDTSHLSSNIAINTSGAITTTGAFTSVGIDDNASGATAITIDSSENVGIGKTSQVDSSKVQIEGAKALSAEIPQQQLNISDSGAYATGRGGAISFSGKYNSGGAQTTFGSLEGVKANGTDANYDGNLVFKTRISGGSNTEKLRILAGGGITFNGDTATANALDDYEEGTWTPTFLGHTTDPTQSYARQYGKYTKIGNTVHCDFNVELAGSGVSAGSGTLYVGGFPFTTTSSSFIHAAGAVGRAGTWNTNAPNLLLAVNNSTSVYCMLGLGGAGDHTWGSATWAKNGSFINASITYTTN